MQPLNLETLTLGEAAYFERQAGMTLMRFFNSFESEDPALAGLAPFVVLLERRAGNLSFSLDDALALPIATALERVTAAVAQAAEAGEPDPES